MSNIVEMIHHLRARLRLVDHAIGSLERLVQAELRQRETELITSLRREIEAIDHAIDVLQRLSDLRSNEYPKVIPIGQRQDGVVQPSPGYAS